MRTQSRTLIVLTLAALSGAGCSQQTLNSANRDAQHNITAADKKAQQIVGQARPQLNKLNVAAPVAAAITTNPNLHGTAIRVDGNTNGVRLRGTVQTPQQKKLAAQIARDTLKPGQTVDNEITVQGQ